MRRRGVGTILLYTIVTLKLEQCSLQVSGLHAHAKFQVINHPIILKISMIFHCYNVAYNV